MNECHHTADVCRGYCDFQCSVCGWVCPNVDVVYEVEQVKP
jgi:hypothetical protein